MLLYSCSTACHYPLPRFHLKICFFLSWFSFDKKRWNQITFARNGNTTKQFFFLPLGDSIYLNSFYVFCLSSCNQRSQQLLYVSPSCLNERKRKSQSHIIITWSTNENISTRLRWNCHKICRLRSQIHKMRSYAFVVCPTNAAGIIIIIFLRMEIGREPSGSVRTRWEGKRACAHNSLIAVWVEIRRRPSIFFLTRFFIVVMFKIIKEKINEKKYFLLTSTF